MELSMINVELKESRFIWNDKYNKEAVISDCSWMLSDYGSSVLYNPGQNGAAGRYIEIMKMLKSYLNENDANIIQGIIAIARLMELARDSPNICVLYVGDCETTVKYIRNIINILSTHHAVMINRCMLHWKQKHQAVFFYGYSNIIYSDSNKDMDKYKDYCYDLIIYADSQKVNYDVVSDMLKKNGELLVFAENESSLCEEYGKIYGDTNTGFWQLHKENKTDILIRYRQSRIDKLEALLVNLKLEIPYIKLRTFEDRYFFTNCRKIFYEELEDIRYVFADNQDEIEKHIKMIEEMMDYEKYEEDADIIKKMIEDLGNEIDFLIKLIKKSKISQNSYRSENEKRIEFIVKNKLISNGAWEYHFNQEKIHFYNWFPPIGKKEDEWIYRFITYNIPNRNKELNFFSVQGDDLRTRFMNKKNKIFYAHEDDCKRFMDGRDFCISSVDLVVTYKKITNKKSLEFPYWIIAIFEPVMDIRRIRERIDEINKARSLCKYDCALIASHDMYMSRTAIVKDLGDILDIHCPGKFNHNTDALQNEYFDNKRKYLKNFMFCACPENCSVHNWVTEKIFDAFLGGNIPIYYGAHNKPLPGIINWDAVLFYDNGGDNHNLRCQIRKLKNGGSMYDKFINQNKLLKGTDEYVYDRMNDLYRRLKEMSM